jgi:hypothetical protein
MTGHLPKQVYAYGENVAIDSDLEKKTGSKEAGAGVSGGAWEPVELVPRDDSKEI